MSKPTTRTATAPTATTPDLPAIAAMIAAASTALAEAARQLATIPPATTPTTTTTTAKRPPIKPEEAAKRLGLDFLKHPGRAVIAMAKRGELRSVRSSVYTLIDPDSVDEFLGGVN